MPKYRVSGTVIGNKCLGEFEADSPEQAEEMAINSGEACVSFCHQCSSECEDPQIEKVNVELVEDDKC